MAKKTYIIKASASEAEQVVSSQELIEEFESLCDYYGELGNQYLDEMNSYLNQYGEQGAIDFICQVMGLEISRIR